MQFVEMEPFTALGLAAAIVQFVQFSSRILSASREIYVSHNGLSKHHESLDGISTHMLKIVEELDHSAIDVGVNPFAIKEEEGLVALSTKCKVTAGELQSLLRKLRTTPGGRIPSFRQAVKGVLGNRKLGDMEASLKEYRLELMVHLAAITRYERF